MQRAAAIIGSAIFLVIAPGTLAVYVPWYLTHWHFAPPLFVIARVLGAALIVAGLPILLDSFARFALQGLGTPVPVIPPKRLVVTVRCPRVFVARSFRVRSTRDGDRTDEE